MRPGRKFQPAICGFFLLLVFQYAGSTSFRQVTPYFLKPNRLFLGLEYENIGIVETALSRFELALDYGVNENVIAGFSMPYFLMHGAQDSGAFGDFQAYIKFLIVQSDVLFWRLSLDVNIQLPTGIIRESSYRKTGTTTASYFPFSTGTAAFAPAFIFSLYLDQFLVSLAASYFSQNSSDENLLNLNVVNDRIDLQLTADYLFKFYLSGDITLYERPSLSLMYKINLSKYPVIPDQLIVIAENHLKLNDDWKLMLSFSMPVIAERTINFYNLAVQIGKFF